MAIIALVGNKGGAGKTTLAVNLASVLDGMAPTAIVDADPQGSSLQWHAIAEHEDPLPVFDGVHDLTGVVPALAQRYAHVVVDCPPSVDAPQTHQALSISDLALVPVQPSPLDLWATVHVEQAIEQALPVNPALQVRLVLNQLEPRTRLSRLVHQALAELGIAAAATAIRRRAIYRTSVLEGRSVVAMGARGRDATEEIRQLIREVITS